MTNNHIEQKLMDGRNYKQKKLKGTIINELMEQINQSDYEN